MTDYEAIVIGGGIAALTAGMYLARFGHATLVLEPAIPGGQLVSVPAIEDFPGFANGVSGYELGPNAQMQAMQAGAEFGMASAEALGYVDGAWLVSTSDGEHQAKTVIIASGSHPRMLGIPGEERLQNRGVMHCASCNGPLYRGKTIGVVGGGDSALTEALTLAGYAGEVIIFHRRGDYAAQQAYLERAREHRNIVFHPDTVVEEVLGDEAVSGVRVRTGSAGDSADIPLDGLFVYIGTEPNTGFLREVLTLDAGGHVPTDIWMRTQRPGLLAAGDVRSNSAAQAVTAAGDGATAAIAAHRFLGSGEWPVADEALALASVGYANGGA